MCTAINQDPAMTETKCSDISDGPDFTRKFSLCLSRTLNEIGLNAHVMKIRRNTFYRNEHTWNVQGRILRIPHQMYHFGSQTEGATTGDLKSDLDCLYCISDINVIQDLEEWEKGKANLLILREDTDPGYCRLQALRSDIPLARKTLPNEEFTFDTNKRVLLENTMSFLNDVDAHRIRSGPAWSDVSDTYGFVDSDIVPAFRCRSWPRHANEFITRHRPYGWPSDELVRKITQDGCFVVAVGNKRSHTPQLEWRISISMAERRLMFSLSALHIKCYTVLKMMLKAFPFASQILSSYHCKMAFLHCIETTEPRFWREDNMLECIKKCMNILSTWISEEFCPQFITPQVNLLVGKITVENKTLLQKLLGFMANDTCETLLNVTIDGLGSSLAESLKFNKTIVSSIDLSKTSKILDTLENAKKQYCSLVIQDVHVTDSKRQYKLKNLALLTFRRMQMLEELARHPEKYERKAAIVLITYLSTFLGSLLASFALSHKSNVPRVALRLLYVRAKSDVACLLKLASILQREGRFRQVEALLQTAEGTLCDAVILPACACSKKLYPMSPLWRVYLMRVLLGEKDLVKHFIQCVRFSPQEIHCAPPALQFELFRSTGDDMILRDLSQDDWMVLAVVDSLPFLHYLQYLNYRKLGKDELRYRALWALYQCVERCGDFDLRHKETAWNMLGQCMELEEQWEWALACYRASLKTRRRNNVAKWHQAILWYNMVKEGRNLCKTVRVWAPYKV